MNLDNVMTAVFVISTFVLSAGCWLAWHPAGFIVAGTLGIVTVFLYARGKQHESEQQA